MISALVIAVVALLAVLRLSQRYGFRKVMDFAGTIFLAIPGFVIAGAVLSGLFHGVTAPSIMARIAIGSVLLLAARTIARKVGWGNVLGWTFSVAMAFRGLVIVAFLLLMFGVAVHATVSGMVFIVVGSLHIPCGGVDRG
jgi:hypothetical protein